MADEKVIPIKVQVENNLPEAEEKFVSLRRQIRETTVELQKLSDEGKAGTKQFGDLTLKLSELRTEQEQVSNKTQGLLSTFGLLGGEIGDFGDKAEVGVQALKTLSSFTLQDIKNQFNVLAQEVGGFLTKISDATGITKIYTVTNEALSKSFVAVGVGEEAAAVGAKALSAALIATGIGALVVGLGLAYDALKELVTGEEAAKIATEEANKALKEQSELLGLDLADAARRQKKYLSDLKASGADERTIREQKVKDTKENLEITQKALEENAALQNKIMKSGNGDLAKAQEEGLKLEQKIKDYKADIYAQNNENIAASNKEAERRTKEANQKAEQEAKRNAAELKRIKEELRKYDESAREISMNEFDKQLSKEKENYDKLLAEAKKFGLDTTQLTKDYQAKVKAIEDKRQEDHLKRTIEFNTKELEEEIKHIELTATNEQEKLVRVEEKKDAIAKIKRDKEKNDALKDLNDNLITKEEYNKLLLLADEEYDDALLANKEATNKKLDAIREKRNQFDFATEDLELKNEMKALDNQLKAKSKSIQAAADKEIDILKKKNAILNQETNNQYKKDKDALDKQLNNKEIDQAEYDRRLIALKKATDLAIQGNNTNTQNAIVEVDKKSADARLNIAGTYARALSGIGDLISAQAGKDKEAQKKGLLISKIGAVAGIAIDTAKNVAKDGGWLSPLGIAEGLLGALGIIGAIQSYEQGLSQIDSVDTGGGSSTSSAAAPITVQGHARGGFIDGPGTSKSDSIPAYLSKGEYVVNANATRAFAPLLNTMNAYGNTPRANFAMGGPTSPSDMQAQSLISAINDNLSRPIKTYVTSQDMSNQQQFHRTIKSRSLI